jgi:hypothetical protein
MGGALALRRRVHDAIDRIAKTPADQLKRVEKLIAEGG